MNIKKINKLFYPVLVEPINLIPIKLENCCNIDLKEDIDKCIFTYYKSEAAFNEFLFYEPVVKKEKKLKEFFEKFLTYLFY